LINKPTENVFSPIEPKKTQQIFMAFLWQSLIFCAKFYPGENQYH